MSCLKWPCFTRELAYFTPPPGRGPAYFTAPPGRGPAYFTASYALRQAHGEEVWSKARYKYLGQVLTSPSHTAPRAPPLVPRPLSRLIPLCPPPCAPPLVPRPLSRLSPPSAYAMGQVGRLKQLFDSYDADHDGRVTFDVARDMIRDAMAALGGTCPHYVVLYMQSVLII